MANLNDYMLWRGDLTLAVSPWNLIDSLAMASLSYNPFSDKIADSRGMTLAEIVPHLGLEKLDGNVYFKQWRQLAFDMADSDRFGQMRMHDYVDVVDEQTEMQFSAISADLSDGAVFVAYRGTDSTLVGWREDFNMSFESPVAAQVAAVDYLERIAAMSNKPIRVSGHSKGGNLAAYAAACASPEVQKRILSVCSFDGPGLDDSVINSEGYARIKPVLWSVLPQSSIVGLLMAYHADYTVVRSTAVSILQHDAFTWQIKGTAFEEMQQVDTSSKIMDETVHEWLKLATVEQRRIFVDAMFDIMEATHASTIKEMSSEKFRTAAAMLQATRSMDVETRKMFNHLLGEFIRLGAGNVWECIYSKAETTVAKRGALPAVEKHE